MAVAPAPDGRGVKRQRLLLAALVALLAVASVLAAWAVASKLSDGDDPQPDREAAMSRAEQFMLRINDYGPDQLDDAEQMPAYRAQVAELLTPKFEADFTENVGIAEQTVTQVGVERSAEVFATGVSDLDDDSARVLVAGRILQSLPDRKGQRAASDPIPFRMVVTLRQVQGEWLVDDYSPASRAEEER